MDAIFGVEDAILVDEKWFQTFLANALRSVSNCCIGQFPDRRHVDRIVVLTEIYKTYKAALHGCVVVRNSEFKTYIDG